VIATLALTVLFTFILGTWAPVVAADLTSQISATRRSQLYFESIMRKQDRKFERLGRDRKSTRKKIRQLTRRQEHVDESLTVARERVHIGTARLEEALARDPDDPDLGSPHSSVSRSGATIDELQAAVDRADDVVQELERQADRIRHRAKETRRHLARVRRRIKATIERREAAEVRLGAHIMSMSRLAQERAEKHIDLWPSRGADAFTWPAEGRVAQPYGCTGFRLNPPRGSCRHFHDGIDLVAIQGTPIKASAVGVVSYVGWNPWDKKDRAFIVIIGHPGGYETRYGHLLPRRRVRPGELVKQDQLIGRMGSTGRSTGVHLHMELIRDSSPLDPLPFFVSQGSDDARTGRRSRNDPKRERRDTTRADAPEGLPPSVWSSLRVELAARITLDAVHACEGGEANLLRGFHVNVRDASPVRSCRSAMLGSGDPSAVCSVHARRVAEDAVRLLVADRVEPALRGLRHLPCG
jgi:murein DD-endopeptidase MepM/ murein hydrolase activator NlpD